jgi:hypothetical protein
MNVIQKIKNHYLHYFSILDAKTDILELDFSKGETESVQIIFIDKKHLSNEQAITILTMRLMMYGEEWTDFAAYSGEDVIHWIPILETTYLNSSYLQNINLSHDADYYFIERLQCRTEIKAIYYNSEKIDFDAFQKLCPLFTEKIINVSKSEFERLEAEFYIETDRKFILFNWHTTA